MTGEPREEMHVPRPDRLPPITAPAATASPTDSALAGAPLPPYRPGMYAGRTRSAISELSAALEAEHDVGPPVAEGFPAAWREDAVPAAEAAGAEEPGAADTAEPSEMLLLDEAEIAPVEEERGPSGFEQAAADVESADSFGESAPATPGWMEPEEPAEAAPGWETGAEPVAEWEVEPEAAAEPAQWDAEPAATAETVPEWEAAAEPEEQGPAAWETPPAAEAAPPVQDAGAEGATGEISAAESAEAPEEFATADTSDVWAWDEEEAAPYDLAPASAEDTGAWQDTWEVQPAGPEGLVGEPATTQDERSAAAGELETTEAQIAEPSDAAVDVHEWLEAGAVEIDALSMNDEPGAHLAFEPAPPAFDERAATPAGEAAESPFEAAPSTPSAYEDEEWAEVEPGEEAGDVVEMVEEDAGSGATPEFAPAAEHAAGPPAGAEVEDVSAEAGQTGDEEDERVAIIPPTPLDSWFHGEGGADAEATWAAFGRALEEAASWGDLGTNPEAAQPSDDAASEAMAGAEPAEQPAGPATEPEPVAEAQAAPSAAADPAVTDLARRLEQLAQRLRSEGEKGVEHAMSEGDRLEASLAGFIAGYFAARRG